jgi:SAM-dependent methyltransferase
MNTAQVRLHAAIEEHHWWFLGRRRIVSELVRRLVPPSKEEVIVDIGCGTGGNIAAFAQEYSCLGIDPSDEAIHSARRRFPHAQFICGAIPDALQDMPRPVSVMLLMDVLEHVPDDFWLLSTLLAQATPGAYLLMTVPADMRLWTEHDVSFGHYRRYDLPRLQHVWRELPVTTCLVSYYNARLYPVIRGIRMVNRWRGRTSGAAGTDFHTPATPLNQLLQTIFAGEAKRLVRCLGGTRSSGFPHGVSLIAIVRREHGIIHPQTKPADVAPDPHTPVGSSGA